MTGTGRIEAGGGEAGIGPAPDEAAREYGSQIITALEQAWAAIRDQHPEIPDVVIVTGAGSNQKGLPKGYRLRGHHWPERWVTGPAGRRMPELFMAGELLERGGRAVLEVMLHEASHALAVVRGIKDTSAEGNRYHNKRFVAAAAEMGLRGPDRPAKVIGWSDCQITDETATAYGEVISAIDTARLPFLPDGLVVTSGGEDGPGGGEGDEDGQGEDKPTKRGGRREAVECACQPPRKLHLTPKQIEDGPVLCGLCHAPFEFPGQDADEAGATGTGP
jgi:hypothetical protein